MTTLLLTTTYASGPSGAPADVGFCLNTNNFILDLLNKQKTDYNNKGFSAPNGILTAINKLSSRDNPLIKKTWRYNTKKVSENLIVFELVGPQTDYSDYNDKCREETLTNFCEQGYLTEPGVVGLIVQCKTSKYK